MAYPSKFQRAENEMYRLNGIQLSKKKKKRGPSGAAEDQSGKMKATRKILRVSQHPDSNVQTEPAFKSVGTSVNR